MKEAVCKKLTDTNAKLAILIDESTTISHLSTSCIHMRSSVDGSSNPVYIFLDLIELPNQTASTIAQRGLECLFKHGFTHRYLEENWILFACDGASVMLGRRSRVATILKADFP